MSEDTETVEDPRVYYRLGQAGSESLEMREASISAMYALGAAQNYGEVVAWSALDATRRQKILDALVDFPDAHRKLREPHIEIRVQTLPGGTRKLKLPKRGDSDEVDAAIIGAFGMVITKTKCPFCGSEDVESTTIGEEGEGWGRRCRSCEALWGVDPAKDDLPGLVHAHTGESVRELMEASDD